MRLKNVHKNNYDGQNTNVLLYTLSAYIDISANY